jgi:hypothetical protein
MPAMLFQILCGLLWPLPLLAIDAVYQHMRDMKAKKEGNKAY